MSSSLAPLLPQGKARVEMAKVDLLLVPTALHHYTVQEIYQEERSDDKVRAKRNERDICCLHFVISFQKIVDICKQSRYSAAMTLKIGLSYATHAHIML